MSERPAGRPSRIDRKYCGSSCRTLACRRRRQLTRPSPESSGELLRFPLRADDLVRLARSAEETVAALRVQFDGAVTRIVGLEAYAATQRSCIAELEASSETQQSRIAELEQQLSERAPMATAQDTEVASAQPLNGQDGGPSPLLDAAAKRIAELEKGSARQQSRIAELEECSAMQWAHIDELEQQLNKSTPPAPAQSPLQASPMSNQPANVVAGTAGLAQTAQSRRGPWALTEKDVRKHLAAAVLAQVEKTIATPGANYEIARQEWCDVDRGFLMLVSQALMSGTAGVLKFAVTRIELLRRAVDRVHTMMGEQSPDQLSAFDEWCETHPILLELVAQTTLRVIG